MKNLSEITALVADLTNTDSSGIYSSQSSFMDGGVRYYLHPTAELNDLLLTAYFEVSDDIQAKIEDLGGFVIESMGRDSEPYIARISNIIAEKAGCGSALHDATAQAVKAHLKSLEDF